MPPEADLFINSLPALKLFFSSMRHFTLKATQLLIIDPQYDSYFERQTPFSIYLFIRFRSNFVQRLVFSSVLCVSVFTAKS